MGRACPRRIVLLTLAAFAMAPGGAMAASDRAWGAQAAGSYGEPNTEGLFFQQPSRGRHLEEIYLTYHQDGFYFQGSALGERSDGAPSTRESTVNELYLDTSVGEWDVTIGKKRLVWGTGFGFRPLDVITHEPRRELTPRLVEGLPLIAVERYTGTLALTLLCGNDFHWSDDRYLRGDDECAARYYGLIDDWDIQLVAHRHPAVNYEAGISVSRVESDNLEWHGSVLYQREYRKWINTLTEQPGAVLAAGDPMEHRRFDNGVKALLGMTYTWASGHALLAEYWYDEAGYRGEEWDALRRLTAAQRELLGSALDAAARANIAASTRFLGEPNALQHNLLLRWSFDGERHDPALDLLLTPSDGGAVLTASIETDLNGPYTLNYGVRLYSGSADAVVRALPDRYRVYLSLKTAFSW